MGNTMPCSSVSPRRLPPYSPGPNPVETLFPVLRHRHLPGQVSGSTGHEGDRQGLRGVPSCALRNAGKFRFRMGSRRHVC